MFWTLDDMNFYGREDRWEEWEFLFHSLNFPEIFAGNLKNRFYKSLDVRMQGAISKFIHTKYYEMNILP